MANKQKAVGLTGARIVELKILRDMLEATGIPAWQITDQRALSACMQVTMAHLRAGMAIAWDWDDARADNGPGEEKAALREARAKADVHKN